ncbi:MAG: GNAT family N-acetyltransferase [Nocardioides sp.]
MPDVRLERMTHDEFVGFRDHSRDGFAAQQVADGVMPPAEARAYAQEQIDRLLPDGIASVHQHLWTVWEGDQRVGHLWVEVRDDADGPGAYVYDVEVAEQARGRGLGRATMLAGERAAANLGARRVRLNVFGQNTAARRLYDLLGYEVAATMMSKRLDGAPPADEESAATVRLVPMTEERYAVFRPQQEASYAANIAASGEFGPEQARAKAAADFDRLLPDGLATPGHELWTGHDGDGTAVGFLWLHVTERSDGRHAFGYDIEVRDDLRRLGYGRAMMRTAEVLCRDQGVVSVGLSVFGFNAGARALYEQQGFTVSAESRVKVLAG